MLNEEKQLAARITHNDQNTGEYQFDMEYLFPTPMYLSKVRNFDEVQEELSGAVDRIEFVRKQEWGQTHYFSNSDFNENLFERYGLDKFAAEADFHLKQYCKHLGFEVKKYRILSWFSMFKPGNYGHIHNHGNVDISGVYYFKTSGHDGDIFFQSPCPSMESSLCYQEIGQRWIHGPKEGKILLFPGWLDHGITTNPTDETRISLAWNVYFDRFEEMDYRQQVFEQNTGVDGSLTEQLPNLTPNAVDPIRL